MDLIDELKRENEQLRVQNIQQKVFLKRYQESMKAYQAITTLLEDQINLFQKVKTKRYGYMGLRIDLLNVEVQNIDELDRVILDLQ